MNGPSPQVRQALAALPGVDTVVDAAHAQAASRTYGRRPLVAAVRDVLERARHDVLAGGPPPSPPQILDEAVRTLDAARRAGLARVVNATGVVLHTNLGRAALSAEARDAVQQAAGYTNLEYDLALGQRGSRTANVGRLAAELCGTEAATVVNNGAAALLLVLSALGAGREVVVSRGELIEIGGSFRLPEVMALSGARMVEVGTTNRTRTADYRAAAGQETGLLVKVHQSNYRMIGFTESAPGSELAALGTELGVPFVYDLGSGLLADAPGGPLADEPSVRAAVEAGTDLVLFSGDKLLGGPQAGIIAGRRDLVASCERHPLARAVRIDKLQRAALEATLTAHLRDEPQDVPTIAMLSATPGELTARATAIAERLAAPDPVSGDQGTGWTGVRVTSLQSMVGGGALPGVELASAGLLLDTPDATRLAARLRAHEPPIIVRIDEGNAILDLRTVDPEEDDLLVAALEQVRS